MAGTGRREGATYSSRMKLLTERPPQLMPAIMLPARLSRRGRPVSRLGLAMEMGLALTKESWRPWPMAESSDGPVVMSTSEGRSRKRKSGYAGAAVELRAGGDAESEVRDGMGMRTGLAGWKRPALGERGVAGCGDGDGDGDGSMSGAGEGTSVAGEAR